MTDAAARQVCDDLGVLLLRRLRAGLYGDVVGDVHHAVDVASYPIMSGIARTGPISAAGLGAQLGIDRSLASRRSAALVAAGLLRSSPDPDDRRATLLELTDEGQRVVDLLRANLTAAVGARMSRWSAADRRELARLFHRFVQDLTDDH